MKNNKLKELRKTCMQDRVFPVNFDDLVIVLYTLHTDERVLKMALRKDLNELLQKVKDNTPAYFYNLWRYGTMGDIGMSLTTSLDENMEHDEVFLICNGETFCSILISLNSFKPFNEKTNYFQGLFIDCNTFLEFFEEDNENNIFLDYVKNIKLFDIKKNKELTEFYTPKQFRRYVNGKRRKYIRCEIEVTEDFKAYIEGIAFFKEI